MLLLVNVKVIPSYEFRPDWMYPEADRKYVLLRNIQYMVRAFSTDEADLDASAEDVLADIRIRLPDTEVTQPFVVPSLTNMARTIYSRSTLRENSDYVELPDNVYKWRVVEASSKLLEPIEAEHNTVYTVVGRWKYLQGVISGVYRRM